MREQEVKPGLMSSPKLFLKTRVALLRSNPLSYVSQKHSLLHRKAGKKPMLYNHNKIKIANNFKMKPSEYDSVATNILAY